MIGACFFYARFIGTVCNCCLSCCHLIALIAGLIYSGGPLGIYCSYNVASVDYEGNYRFKVDRGTYQDDRNLMKNLSIVQLVLFIIQFFFCWAPLHMTPNTIPEVMPEGLARKRTIVLEKTLTLTATMKRKV